MGMSRAALLSAQQAERPFGVWPENWDAVQLFLAASTQWRFDALGRKAGLDYSALQWPMRSLQLRGRRALRAFAGMQALEAAYLKHSRGKPARPRQLH